MDDLTQAVSPALNPTGSKANRGFNHPLLWLMLAPASLIDEYRKAQKLDR